MAEGKVSIILVNYNGFKDTIDCLYSLRNIDYENYEVIIVDNASTDCSVSEIRKVLDPDEVLLEAKTNGGFSAGNNVGIQYALEHGAEYCLLLNNDTVVEKKFLSSLMATVMKYGGQVVVTSKIMYFYDQSKIWYAGGTFSRITSRTTHIGINETDVGQYDALKEVSFISGCCMLIPREVLDRVGKMDEGYFLYCEDLDYCCRIRKAGYRLIYEPRSVIYHKVNATTGKMSDVVTYYMVRNKLYILDRYIEKKYRCISVLYTCCEILKRTVTKEYNLKAVFNGIQNYRTI